MYASVYVLVYNCVCVHACMQAHHCYSALSIIEEPASASPRRNITASPYISKSSLNVLKIITTARIWSHLSSYTHFHPGLRPCPIVIAPLWSAQVPALSRWWIWTQPWWSRCVRTIPLFVQRLPATCSWQPSQVHRRFHTCCAWTLAQTRFSCFVSAPNCVIACATSVSLKNLWSSSLCCFSFNCCLTCSIPRSTAWNISVPNCTTFTTYMVYKCVSKMCQICTTFSFTTYVSNMYRTAQFASTTYMVYKHVSKVCQLYNFFPPLTWCTSTC